MASPNYRIRRATVEDLDVLKSLWESMRFPAQTLEKRLTEFQVAEDAGKHIVGIFGFQIQGRHGHIHSEAFGDFSLADELRPLFWQRIQALAMNHGIARLWTQERAPFWSRNGFQPATNESLQKLPEAWSASNPGWLTLQLKDEEAITSLEHEVMMLMQTEKQRTASTLETARTFKAALTVIGILLALAILGLAAYVYLTRGTLVPQPR